MKKRSLLMGLLVMVVLTGAAPELSGDVARLQGRWGTRLGAKKEVEVVLTIKGCRVNATITTPAGMKVKAAGELKLDEATQPKSLDWIKFKTPDGVEVPELQAIYRLEGNRLTLRSGGFNDSRPTTFEPGDGIWADVLVFERQVASR
jgi:uncharacterized protein (TIGR03067 family)